MKPRSLPLLAAVAIAAAWHGATWLAVRVAMPVPVPPASRPAVVVLPQPVAADGASLGLLRSPVLFALPYGPGFSRYLERNAANELRPRMEFPDLVPVLGRTPVVLTNRLVLADAAVEDRLARLSRLPAEPPPEITPGPAASAAAGLRLRAPAGWGMDGARMRELEALSAEPWSCAVRLEISPGGAVLHTLFEESTGLAPLQQARVAALLRQGRLPPAGEGRSVLIRLDNPPRVAP